MRRAKLTFCCFLSEINILTVTRSREINILTHFELMRRVKLTFRCFLSEINILAITRAHEINILTFFDLKLTFFIFHVA